MKREHFWAKISVCTIFLLLSGSCLFSSPMGTEATPTPHYTPMSGYVYIIPDTTYKYVPLFTDENISLAKGENVETDTQVKILESEWFYRNNKVIGTDKTVEKMCYVYHIQVPGTSTHGWVPQDDLTTEKGAESLLGYGCFEGGRATATPTPGAGDFETGGTPSPTYSK